MDLLGSVLSDLRQSICYARNSGQLSWIGLTVIDNSADEATGRALRELSESLSVNSWCEFGLQLLYSNVGYGTGHNIASPKLPSSDYHLILNPDVLMDEKAIYEAIRFMDANSGVGLLTPNVVDERGDSQYLNRRYPSVLVLAVRALNAEVLKKIFRRKLAYYEMKECDLNSEGFDIPLASGCFMFCRAATLSRAGGFDTSYFMYFEDYDLSIRIREYASIAYSPGVKIVHLGGGASRKGSAHILMFIRSAIRFFNKHGWCVV